MTEIDLDKVEQLPCHIVYTNEKTHEIIKEKRYVKQAKNYVCEDCGKEIIESKVGEKIYSAAELAKYTHLKYGKILCTECASRMKWVMSNADTNNEGNSAV